MFGSFFSLSWIIQEDAKVQVDRRISAKNQKNMNKSYMLQESLLIIKTKFPIKHITFQLYATLVTLASNTDVISARHAILEE